METIKANVKTDMNSSLIMTYYAKELAKIFLKQWMM
jgi:hypothetical protein